MRLLTQMKQACSVPMAAGAAVMADAHVGYGLPIGGVLALEDAVIPYAVGVDIAVPYRIHFGVDQDYRDDATLSIAVAGTMFEGSTLAYVNCHDEAKENP